MSWRNKWSLFYTIRRTRVLKTLSVRHFSSSRTVYLNMTDKPHQSFSRDNTKVILTPQIVRSILLNCPSDLIALSFFVWCAKQHNYFHNNQAFDYMVGVVSRLTRRYKTVKGIVKELESVGLIPKAQTFLLLLRIYWRGGLYSMVFETFEQMNSFGFEPNTFARNVVVDVLLKFGHVDAGIKFLKESRFPNFLSFSITLCNLCKLNDLVNIKDILQIMFREGYYPNVETFEMVLNSHCKMGRLAMAYQVLGTMITLGISLSVNVWSILIDGFCRLHQPVMASYLLEKMVKSGCSPNVVTYTTLFKGFMDSRMISSAFSLLNIMESRGCAPDLLLCNVLIDSLTKIGRYDDALDTFLGLSKRKLLPDAYTFSSLLSTICYSRKFNILPEVVSGLVIEADLVMCNSLLNYYCKAGYPDLAVELYNDMIDKGFTPDNYSFVGLLRGLCGVKRVNDAVNVYLGIVRNNTGLDAHVHTAIINGLIKNGYYHRAIRLFKRAFLKQCPLDIVSYTVAIYGLLKSGRSAEASTLYNQMKEFGQRPSVHTYNIMLYFFCVERDIKMVNMLLQEIIEAGAQLDCNIFIQLISNLHKPQRCPSPFIKLWNMVLVPDEAMHVLSFDGLNHNVKSRDENHSLLKGCPAGNLFEDSSSSDDILDVAASIG